MNAVQQEPVTQRSHWTMPVHPVGTFEVCSWNKTLRRCWTRKAAAEEAKKQVVLTRDTVWVFRAGNTKSIAIFHVTMNSDKAQGV